MQSGNSMYVHKWVIHDVEVFCCMPAPKLPRTHHLGNNNVEMHARLMMHCKMPNKLLSEMHANFIRPQTAISSNHTGGTCILEFDQVDFRKVRRAFSVHHSAFRVQSRELVADPDVF